VSVCLSVCLSVMSSFPRICTGDSCGFRLSAEGQTAIEWCEVRKWAKDGKSKLIIPRLVLTVCTTGTHTFGGRDSSVDIVTRHLSR